MKKIFILTTLCLATVVAFAQNPIKKGDKVLNAGLGFSSFATPVYVGLEFGVHEDISVAGEVSYQSKSYGWGKISAFGVSAKGNYHFNRILEIDEKWDLYGGIGLNYYNFSNKYDVSGYTYSGKYDSGIGFDAQVGGRYFFSEKFGVNLEFGGGSNLSGGRFGISYKL
ncbi:outer membrane beta-barrel protein [Pedobacter sp. UC225_65]|uniref:outer membrane beta-barrel protein n=1 Tax=Pedobacter sp. UC225_65 TaxID=3350173 RepID=UPI00366DCAA6